MGLFVVMEEGVVFPSARGGIRLTIRGNMVSGLEIGFQLGFGFRGSQEFVLRVGIFEGSRVPFLAGRLVLLVGFIAFTIELFAISHVKIASVAAVGFAMNLLDSRCGCDF